MHAIRARPPPVYDGQVWKVTKMDPDILPMDEFTAHKTDKRWTDEYEDRYKKHHT